MLSNIILAAGAYMQDSQKKLFIIIESSNFGKKLFIIIESSNFGSELV